MPFYFVSFDLNLVLRRQTLIKLTDHFMHGQERKSRQILNDSNKITLKSLLGSSRTQNDPQIVKTRLFFLFS